MGYFNTRGLRGSELEEMINFTNELYIKEGLAVVQKVPTPIKPVEISSDKNTITLAYFDQKSTVDYIGVAQGIPICFDAKQTNASSLPLANIHNHQIEFMENFNKQKGISFLIVYFKKFNKYYIMPLDMINECVDKMNCGGRKSVSHKEFDDKYEIKLVKNMYLNYLDKINDIL